ncbi:MAG: EamA family transporter [Clostridia bacterium]|nr:EamA family transporter [Clostridia bacterium]
MKKSASLLIILAGIIWGTMGVFVTEMEKMGFNSLQISSIRVTVAALIFILTVWVTDKSRFKIKIKDLWIFFVMGFGCVLGMSMLYFYTIVNTSLSTAAILLYTSPIWVILISAIVFKEKLTWKKIVALVCAFAGCVLVSYSGGESGSVGLWFFLTGLGSGIAYGLYSIFGTVALKKYHPYTVTMYSFIFAAISSWFIAKLWHTMAVVQAYPNKPYIILWMVLVGFVTAYTTFMLYTLGLKHTAPGKAAIMACTEPLTATIIGVFMYDQSASVPGILLIIFAILLVNNFGINRTEQKNTP